jgi:hypothetical protein
MPNDQATLNNFFVYEEGLTKDQLSRMESAECVSLIKEKISEVAKEIKWDVAMREIVIKIVDLLDIPIPDILTKAWRKYVSLQEYLDKSEFSPDETFLIPLAEHMIESKHHPYIEILTNDVPIGKIEFEIDVSLKLKGIILKVKNRKIKEIQTGECEGRGSVKCENHIILEKKLGEISLPGSIDLGEGISITG